VVFLAMFSAFAVVNIDGGAGGIAAVAARGIAAKYVVRT
jgi:hypothetical protein